MSFFDDADETRVTPRPRHARTDGGGGHRPPDHQTLLTRRLIAAGAIVLAVILMFLLVKGCVDSRRTQALKDYNRDVRSLLEQSRSAVSRPLFEALQSASGSQPTQVQETINQLRVVADEELAQAKGIDAPGGMEEAQRILELLLSLRRDGVEQIADLIQPAVGKSAAAGNAVNEIAGQMRAFDASDVLYSQRVAPLLLAGLKDHGIAASYDGTAGEQVDPELEFLPNIGWISASNVAQQLGTSAGGSSPDGTPAPGLHGHKIDSVSVGSTTLVAGGSNQIPASPPPTFMVSFTNGGEHDETDVKVTVEVTGASGAPVKGQAVVPTTTAGQPASANVELDGTPPTSGPVTIKVTVEKVPGEETLDNNVLTFNALFE